jgi:Ca2+/Na+ antiporter
MNHRKKPILLVLSILLSAAGVAGFIYLFVLDFNIYWLFLSPIIIALYQVPAAFVFWLYKRKRAAPDEKSETAGDPSQPGRP